VNRRKYAALIVGSVVTGGVVSGRSVEEPRARHGDDGPLGGDGREVRTESPASETGPSDPAEPRTFSGSGTATTDEFDLNAGPVAATFVHEGESNFIVELLTLAGESYEDVSLVNRIGRVSGSQVAEVRADGAHVLNVDADGPWEMALEQPTDPDVGALPTEATGAGLSFLGPIGFDGPTETTGSHDGESNFIVETVPLDPEAFGTLVFNEIGRFEGSTTARIDGPAFVNVVADGEWDLSFAP